MGTFMMKPTVRQPRRSPVDSRTKRRGLLLELLESRNLMAADLDGPAFSSSSELSTSNPTDGAPTISLVDSSQATPWKTQISPSLTTAFSQTLSPTLPATDDPMAEYLMYDAAGRIDVHFSGEDLSVILESVKQLGFEPLYINLDHNSVDGFLPVSALPELNNLLAGHSVAVTPNWRPQTSVGLVTSEADIALQTRRVRGASPTGYDGNGVRIGVLSDSYNNLNGAAADITSGDLPAGGVTVLQDLSSGGSDEGRAMLQLVHDLAPAATLGFATAFVGGQAGFAANIVALANTFNADVITDDVFYFSEPFFQDGIIAQAIDNVVQNSDVAYFSSAGNVSDQSFELTGPFTTGTTTFAANSVGLPSFTTNSALDLDPSANTDFRQSITLNNNQRAILALQWDQPFYASVTNDLDFFLVDTTNNELVAFSASNNLDSDEPVEILAFTNNTGAPRTYEIIVELFSGPAPGRLKWVNYGANSSGAIATIEYDTNSPTITPHSASINAMSVGAVPYFDQRTPESFSSIGPSTILFAPNGTPIAQTVRAKPDFAAIDGTNNTFFGGDAEGDGRPNFFGTSAAAPHAAAVAALMRQANPSLTASQVYSQLKQTATDITPAGVDVKSGSGLINAYPAIFGAPITGSLPLTDNFSTALDKKWEVFSTTNGRVQVVSLNNNGDSQLTMDTFFGFNNSLNEAVLHFNAIGTNDILLKFDQREFSDEDNPMPATFTGSSNSDGVALSVDGTNWFRLVSLTGANSTSSFTTKSFNLSQIAQTLGLTLGADVRIKFQQFDNSPIVSDGMAFDNISIAKAPNVAPVFGQASYAFSLAENAISGAPIGSVSATDANLGDVLVYSLSGTGASNFNINANTGAITVAPSASLNAVLTPTYNLTVSVTDGTATTNAPLTLTVTPFVTVSNTKVFYKGSAFASSGVAAALDPTKVVAQSGLSQTTLGYANMSNTTFGINGLVLDVNRLAGSTLTSADFNFRMSPQGLFNEATNPPSSWPAAPAPSGIFVTPATATTPARVRLEWNNNAIANRWLQIQLLNTANTGLPTTQVFYFGHLQGELNGEVIGNAFFVTNADIAMVNPIGTAATVGNPRDVDKNRFILNADGIAIRNSVNAGLSLRQITIPAAGSGTEGRLSGAVGGGSGSSAVFFNPSSSTGGVGTNSSSSNSTGSSTSQTLTPKPTGTTIPPGSNSTNTTSSNSNSVTTVVPPGLKKSSSQNNDSVFTNFEDLGNLL